MRPLGIYVWFGYDLSVEESLRRIRATGFDQVLLWWGETEGQLPLSAQPDAARRLGLTVENAHAPFGGCNRLWLPGEEGDWYADQLVACLAGCAGAGVPALVVHLTDGANPPPCSSLGLERLRRVADAAQRHGVTLLLENLRHAAHLRAALDTLDAVRFCYDSGHHHGWCAEQPYLEDYGSRLGGLHLHDNDGSRDAHRLPFDGTIDWPGLAKKLRESGYGGGISLEVQATANDERHFDAEEFLSRAWASADRVRRLVDIPNDSV